MAYIDLTQGIYTALDVTGKDMIFLDTSGGEIQIKGFANGVKGQKLSVLRPGSSTNTVSLLHQHAGGTQKLANCAGTNTVIVASNDRDYEVRYIYDGTNWNEYCIY